MYIIHIIILYLYCKNDQFLFLQLMQQMKYIDQLSEMVPVISSFLSFPVFEHLLFNFERKSSRDETICFNTEYLFYIV